MSSVNRMITVPQLVQLHSRKYNWRFDWSEINERQDVRDFDYRKLSYDTPTDVYGVDHHWIERLGGEPERIETSSNWSWLRSPWTVSVLVLIAILTGYFGWWQRK